MLDPHLGDTQYCSQAVYVNGDSGLGSGDLGNGGDVGNDSDMCKRDDLGNASASSRGNYGDLDNGCDVGNGDALSNSCDSGNGDVVGNGGDLGNSGDLASGDDMGKRSDWGDFVVSVNGSDGESDSDFYFPAMSANSEYGNGNDPGNGDNSDCGNGHDRDLGTSRPAGILDYLASKGIVAIKGQSGATDKKAVAPSRGQAQVHLEGGDNVDTGPNGQVSETETQQASAQEIALVARWRRELVRRQRASFDLTADVE